MRERGDPDRFPVSDLGLVKAAEVQGIARRELPGSQPALATLAVAHRQPALEESESWLKH